jgi:hypothetical protein
MQCQGGADGRPVPTEWLKDSAGLLYCEDLKFLLPEARRAFHVDSARFKLGVKSRPVAMTMMIG